jgi:hypothetical protein
VISFRYHLVTIVALFLALGLGVLAGTTVLDQSLVNSLENRTDELTRDLGGLREDVSTLRAQVAAYDGVVDEMAPVVSGGLLVGRDIVIVTHEDVDGGSIGQAQASLQQGSATVRGVLTVRDQMAATDADARRELASILDLPASTDASDVVAEGAQQLGRRLAVGGGGAVDGREDLLSRLLSAGFLTAEGSGLSDATIGELGGGDVIVVISGGQRAPSLEPDAFLVPMVDVLVRLRAPVAAGESLDSSYPFVVILREDGVGGDAPMLTVDDVDLGIGGLALTLGLERLLELDEGGDYGLKTGASDPIPPLPVA